MLPLETQTIPPVKLLTKKTRMGLSTDDAMAVLRLLRAETGEGVGELRLAWGDRFSGVRDI